MKKLMILFGLLLSILSVDAQKQVEEPIILRTMGSLFFGGTINWTSEGEPFHGDHGYAQFYIPQDSRTYPLVMWHGIGQSGRTYESTPDGREGYMAILPRKKWSVYIIDQPRRGRAGYTTSKVNEKDIVPALTKESAVWEVFRNGTYTKPDQFSTFERTQFPKTDYAINNFFRQQTPDTGEEPRTKDYRDKMGNTMKALFQQIGPSILITHSNSGQYGWATAIITPDSVKAIIAYEPGACVFPDTDIPKKIESDIPLINQVLQPQTVSMKEFENLTKIPILIVFGDNISNEKSDNFNVEAWRVSSLIAQQFVETINRYGGDAHYLSLPEIGIYGNTHAPFADLNNLDIATLLENFLKEKGLDGCENSHKGPLYE